MTGADRRPVLPAPRRTPAAVPLGVVVALALLALAAAAVRDLAVERGWATGTPWAPELVDAADGFEPGTLATAAAYAAVVVGLLLVVAALTRGRRTHLRVRSPLEAWVSVPALAATARVAADRAPGVLDARVVRSTRRRVVVEVAPRSAADDGAVTEAARTSIVDVLPDLPAVRVAVKARRHGDGR